MNEQKLRFRLGVFVLFAIALLLGMVWLFGGRPTLFVSMNQYTIILDNGAGIGPGTPVRRAGVRIGEVRKVELDDQTGEVRVTIEVQQKYTVRENDQPVVTRNFLGDPAIDFETRREPAIKETKRQQPAGASEEAEDKQPLRGVVPPGAEIKGRSQNDLNAAIVELGKAAQSFNRMSGPLEKGIGEMTVTAMTWRGLGENLNVLLKTNEELINRTLKNTNDTILRVGEMVSPENQRNLNATLKNTRAASDSFESIAKNTDAFVKDGRQTLTQVNASLKQLDPVLANLNKLSRPLADRSEAITKNLDQSADKLNRLLGSLLALMGSDGTLNKLMNDPALYNNLNTLACGLARMLPELDRILKDVEVFADKIARHPESLGVGGAIRQGSGLK